MKPFEELKSKFNAQVAHTFIFHGATFDFMDEGKFLKNYLVYRFSEMSKPAKNIIYYDRADGITFPSISAEEAFKTMVGDALALYGGELPKDPVGAFDVIGKAMRKGHFVLIVDYAESVFPNGDMSALSEMDRVALISLLKWAKDDENIRNLRNPIILITSALSRLNPLLREPSSRIETIGIPYPDPQERLAFIDSTLAAYAKRKTPLVFEEGFPSDFMSRATAGLAKVHIADIMQRSKLTKTPISLDMVKERKNDIIRAEFQDVLQIIEPEFGFEMIGGYDYVKQYFKKNVIDAIKAGNHRRLPMGILLSGPAGTGKTAMAQALAHEAGVNFVSFNIGRLFNKWVGSSEENIEKAIWAIKSIRPVIVFIDELDTAISRGNSGDSGVSNRLMKSLLEFMSDTSHRGEIVFLAATNKPEDIDFALKRTGRFDKKIPMLPPSATDVPDVYMVMFKRHKINHTVSAEQISHINTKGTSWDNTNTLVGSDIEAIVLKAFELAEDDGRGVVSIHDVEDAMALIKPTVQDTAGMIASALKECNDLSLLPEAYRKANASNASAKSDAASFVLA